MAMSLNRFSNGIACRESCTNDQPCFPIEIDQNDPHRSHMLRNDQKVTSF